MPEACRAGLRTIEEDLFRNHYAETVVQAMMQTTVAVRTANPGVGLRELTDTLAESDHNLDIMIDGVKTETYAWGPTGSLAVRRGEVTARKRLVCEGVTTERLALAVATCATRDCDFQGSCAR